MKIMIKVVDPAGVDQRRAPFDPVNLIAFGEKEFGQIRAVLAGDAGH